MELVKVTGEKEILYFSTKTKAARFLNLQQSNINYYLYKGVTPNGWKIELTNDPEVRNGDIDSYVVIPTKIDNDNQYRLLEGTNKIIPTLS